jgi:hypothetical protein
MATPDFQVYVSSFSGERVDVFRGDGASGELEPLGTLPLSGKGLAMAKSSDRRFLFLYVASFADVAGGKQARYETVRIDPGSGRLHPLGMVRAPAYMVHIATDRTGRFLLGASEPTGLIAANPIGARGLPQEVPAHAIGALRGTKAKRWRRRSGCGGAACIGTDHVLQLRFDDRSGRFAANTPAEIYLQSGAGPRHMARQRRCDPCPRQRPGRCRHMDLSEGEAAGTGHTITFSILPGLDASHFVIEGNQLKVGSAGDRLSRGHGASGRGAGHRLPWRLHRADLRHHRPGPGK